ncbi:hypothetical protein M8J71_11785 [Pseudarthrobacter sp. R1]|nr:hypothetical protein [Pseudarthrobacter sp. R1]
MKAQDEETEPTRLDTAGIRGSAVAGGVGGLCLMAYGIVQAMQPPGCIAEECVGRTYRSAGALEGLLFVAGLLLVIGATLGVRAVHPAGARVVRVAALVAASAMFFGFVLMGSALYFAGLALTVVGVLAYAVLGIGLVVARTLPAWAGVMLTVSALLVLGANDQNERVLFVLPFGLAWLVLGALLWISAAPRNESRRGGVRLA